MTQVSIRRAGVGDAQTLSELGAATFAEAFGPRYAAEDLDQFLAETYAVEKVRAQLEDPANAAWLAEAGGRAVGHALAGACALSHPEVTAACGELKRLYVLSGWRGGLGSRLLATALAWLEDQGRSRVWLGVWSGNLGAVRLYRKMGFEQVGHYQFRVGAARDHELILRRG